nr:MAG TPA: hypothetical protein [Caudoviricetes sp.]
MIRTPSAQAIHSSCDSVGEVFPFSILLSVDFDIPVIPSSWTRVYPFCVLASQTRISIRYPPYIINMDT